MSSLTNSSDNKNSTADQENEFNFFDAASIQNLPTPSPNRSKYEGKFGKRRPLGEKTNKNSEKSNELKEKEGSSLSACKTAEEKKKKEEEVKEKKAEESTLNTAVTSNVSFQNLFHLNENVKKSDSTGSSSNSSSSNNKIEELSTALSETLQENEQLHDTVSLLKAEINRLNGELMEYKEYGELYLLGKELIENQGEEIENQREEIKNLKQKLVKRGD